MQWLDRILNRQPAKAVYGGAWTAAYAAGGQNLTSLTGVSPQDRMAKYLQAYSVGWFHKGGRKISLDVAGLTPVLAYEDAEGDNEDDIVAPRNSLPFDSLTPEEQFLRLMERPNPSQTGRQLRQKTQIRLDFAGAAFWYLESNGDLPTAIYGINPARMEPSVDKAGNLLGWVMDRGRNGSPGTPFDASEILLFSTACSGDDWYGTSIVESVWTQVPLTDMIARHTADVLTTGGRLAGMAWPKNRALEQPEFEEAQRAWRNVASDPNAARRLLLFPEPMEYIAGASTPKEIGIPELAQLSRDEITTAFPINPYVLGVPVEPGLSSGETLKYVSRDYWRNSVHDRAELLEETIQVGLVPLYEAATGRPLDFDLEEPDLDGPAEVIEKAGALRALITLGFDPKAAIGKVGLDDVKWDGLPASLDPAQQVPASEQPTMRIGVNDTNLADTSSTTQGLAKAVKARREEVVGEALPGFIPTMEAFLAGQRDRIAEAIERTYGPVDKAARKALPEADWWDAQREDAILRNTLDGLYLRLSRSALTVVANEVGRIVMPERIRRVTEVMLADATKRIHDINETTREAVVRLLAEGSRRGYSLNQLLYGVPGEEFTGLRELGVFDNYRAELVARTETMLAYNKSALLGYQEYNIREVQASDGDYDEECRARDGQVFPTEEAFGIEDHPNGTLDWIPVVPDLRKSWEPAPTPIVQNFYVGPDAIKSLDMDRPDVDLTPVVDGLTALREDIKAMPAPVVEVAAPVVNVTQPDVFVQPAPVQDVRIVGSTLPAKKRTVKRDQRGLITEVNEE